NELGIIEISHSEAGLVFKIGSQNPPPIENIMTLAANNKGKILYGAGEKPYILLRDRNLSEKNVIENINNVLKGLQIKSD
ncbi:MAG: hypothetical protein ACI4SS_06250, partial [Clostridia bacterium]